MKLDRVKFMRERRNLTKQQVAEDLQVSAQSYGNYENGRREPGISVLKALAKYFSCSVDYIVEYDYADSNINTWERTFLIKLRQLSVQEAEEISDLMDVKLKKKSPHAGAWARSS